MGQLNALSNSLHPYREAERIAGMTLERRFGQRCGSDCGACTSIVNTTRRPQYQKLPFAQMAPPPQRASLPHQCACLPPQRAILLPCAPALGTRVARGVVHYPNRRVVTSTRRRGALGYSLRAALGSSMGPAAGPTNVRPYSAAVRQLSALSNSPGLVAEPLPTALI